MGVALLASSREIVRPTLPNATTVGITRYATPPFTSARDFDKPSERLNASVRATKPDALREYLFDGERKVVAHAHVLLGPGDRVVVSRDGGIQPVWSPTGREIFYRSADGRRMMAVDIETTPKVSVGTPHVLFEGPYRLAESFWADYDVWPDGNEFLMVAVDDAPPPGIHVFINWISEVPRRVGAPE